jgi:FkbM family methyltransferase
MKFKEIIAFEPDLETLNLLRNTIPKVKEIIIEQKGLWSYTGKNKFISSENNDVLPGGTSFSNDGKLEIDVIKLDDYLGNKKIDFIKMDTLGGMIEALHGAADTIKKYTPILALGIYHHMDDIFKIPLFINYINPKYRLYLRHNQWLINETDLFAIK